MNFKNGRTIQVGDAAVGTDWRGGPVTGTVAAGDTKAGLPEMILVHGVHKAPCPSLDLRTFLHADDAAGNAAGASQVGPAAAASPPA